MMGIINKSRNSVVCVYLCVCVGQGINIKILRDGPCAMCGDVEAIDSCSP